jgi:fructokinase
VSGSGLARDHAARGGAPLGAEAIVEGARAGEAACAKSLDLYVDRLGRGLAMICNILDPDVIVFGGGMSKAQELYDRLPAAIDPWVFADAWAGRLAPARWGDASGVRGAARLWDGG